MCNLKTIRYMRALIAILTLVAGLMMTANDTQAQTVTWPFGSADVEQQTYIESDTDLTVTNSMSYQAYKPTADVTLNLPNVQTRPGGFLFLELVDDGSGRTVTFGTNLKGNSVTLTAEKTFVACFIHNGSQYINYSVQQVN